jgi:hypothetical protein
MIVTRYRSWNTKFRTKPIYGCKDKCNDRHTHTPLVQHVPVIDTIGRYNLIELLDDRSVVALATVAKSVGMAV